MTGSRSERLTIGWAARCSTTSGFACSSTSRTASASRTSTACSWMLVARPASSYSDGILDGPGDRPITSAPSDCSHSDSHAPLKPVWPVMRTRRCAQNWELISTAGGYLHAIETSAASTPSATPQTAEILGIPLAISDYEEVLDWMDATIAADGRAYVTAAAVNLIMSAQEQPDTLAAVLGATLAVPDGQPLVWALHALGHARATRVYGPNLMASFCARAASTGTPIYLYGGRGPDARRLLEERLGERFPGLRIAGAASPPFRPLTPEEDEREIEMINSSGAAVVWVGTGQPTQEKWTQERPPRLPPPLLVGVGAAFDFHAGLVSQAPPWMQRNGLEWTYRLSREPRRLWRRYARYNPLLVGGFARQYLRPRRARAGTSG